MYGRWEAQEHLYIVINRDDEAVVRLPCHAAEDLLDEQTRVDTDTDDLVLRIPACSARILRVTE